MPGVDGLGVSRVLRMQGDQVPILMLTARVDTDDRVAGLDAGADDYVAKPFELAELLAWVRALLRRSVTTGDPPDRLLTVADLRLDPLARRVWRKDDEAAGGIAVALMLSYNGSADLLGTAALFTLAASFEVTPLQTLTGWRWHVILRRDFGMWAAGFALIDLAIAGLTTPDGWLTGTAGKAFLAAGTLAALLTIPLALTSNRRSMRWLGRDWKRLHRLVYVVWVLIALHLYLLEGVRGLVTVALLVGPLILLRVPRVRRWVVRRRRQITDRRAGRRAERGAGAGR